MQTEGLKGHMFFRLQVNCLSQNGCQNMFVMYLMSMIMKLKNSLLANGEKESNN